MDSYSLTFHKAVSAYKNGVVGERSAVIHFGAVTGSKGDDSRRYPQVVTAIYCVVTCV